MLLHVGAQGGTFACEVQADPVGLLPGCKLGIVQLQELGCPCRVATLPDDVGELLHEGELEVEDAQHLREDLPGFVRGVQAHRVGIVHVQAQGLDLGLDAPDLGAERRRPAALPRAHDELPL